jgi:hypothetical protein
MDYVKPQDMVKGMLSTAEMKLNLPVHRLLMRGALFLMQESVVMLGSPSMRLRGCTLSCSTSCWV